MNLYSKFIIVALALSGLCHLATLRAMDIDAILSQADAWPDDALLNKYIEQLEESSWLTSDIADNVEWKKLDYKIIIKKINTLNNLSNAIRLLKKFAEKQFLISITAINALIKKIDALNTTKQPLFSPNDVEILLDLIDNYYYKYPVPNTANQDLPSWIAWCIERGIPADSKNKSGFTAMQYAISVNRSDVVTVLLTHGAQVTTQFVVGPSNETPISFAEKLQHTDIVAILENPPSVTWSSNRQLEEILYEKVKTLIKNLEIFDATPQPDTITRLVLQNYEPAVIAGALDYFFTNLRIHDLYNHRLSVIINTIIDYIKNNKLAYAASHNAINNIFIYTLFNTNSLTPVSDKAFETYTSWLRFLVEFGLKGRINTNFYSDSQKLTINHGPNEIRIQNFTILDYVITFFAFGNITINKNRFPEIIKILKEYGADQNRTFTLEVRTENPDTHQSVMQSYTLTSLEMLRKATSADPLLKFDNDLQLIAPKLIQILNPAWYSRSGSTVLKAAVGSISVYAFYYWLKNRWSSTQATINDDVLINNTDADIIITYLQESDSAQSTSTTIAPGKRAQLAQTGTLHIYRNTTEKPLIINLDTYATNRTEHYLNIGISKNWLSWLFGPLRYTIHWVDKNITE